MRMADALLNAVIDPFTSPLDDLARALITSVIEHDRGRHVARVRVAIGVCVTLS